MSRTTVAGLALMLTAVAFAPGAMAQTAQTAPANVAPFSADTPVETLAANPAARAVLENDVPMLLNHPSYETIKSLSLRQIQPYSNGALTDPMIASADAHLKALAGK